MKQFVFFLCLSVFALIYGCKQEPELTRLYPVPDFSLIDQTGDAVTLAELKGKVWIADFIFTNCGGTCPMMTDKMRKLQNVVPQEIRMVSFSVDPDRDTSKVLAAYAAEQGATRDRWLFLTGNKQALYDLCLKGFKLPLDEATGTPAEPITHSTRFVLVDREGMIRGYYSATEEEDLKRLSADAKKL
jgi:protein SCO1